MAISDWVSWKPPSKGSSQGSESRSGASCGRREVQRSSEGQRCPQHHQARSEAARRPGTARAKPVANSTAGGAEIGLQKQQHARSRRAAPAGLARPGKVVGELVALAHAIAAHPDQHQHLGELGHLEVHRSDAHPAPRCR